MGKVSKQFSVISHKIAFETHLPLSYKNAWAYRIHKHFHHQETLYVF